MEPLRFTVFETAWGWCGFAGSTYGIARLLLPLASRRTAIGEFQDCIFEPDLMKDLQKAVKKYFRGEEVDFRTWPPVDAGRCAPAFTKAVLRECRKIAYGKLSTYGELAQRAGRPHAARAVGAILARNHVPLIIPCHRITYATGALSGFSAAGGIEIKKRMLSLESSQGGF
jgi:methylated-DNA-[protein]-cysteine S-methyltransferase